MKRAWLYTPIMMLALVVLLGSGGVMAAPESGVADATDPLVVRGEYLTRAADCQACHTVDGGTPFAGGRPFQTPMGTLYSPNLTPDGETGIGRYTAESFRRALHDGIDHEGRHLYPAFPYDQYTLLTDDDVEAIRRYLMTLAPVHAPKPENDMTFPFNQRWGMFSWNWLNFDNRRFVPDPNASDEVNRGAYLVEALGHCGACHTPRTLTYGRDTDRKFMGADIDGWQAYNITNDPLHGIGQWSAAQIAAYLGTGNVPGLAQAGGPMAEVIADSTRHLTEGDRLAMAAYLKTIAPQTDHADETVGAARSAHGHPATIAALRATPLDDADRSGQRLFMGLCASCHNWQGSGAAQGLYPSLYHNSTVGADEATNLIQVVLHGIHRTGADHDTFMPGFADDLDDADTARLINYVLTTFGNDQVLVSASDVAALRGDEATKGGG